MSRPSAATKWGVKTSRLFFSRKTFHLIHLERLQHENLCKIQRNEMLVVQRWQHALTPGGQRFALRHSRPGAAEKPEDARRIPDMAHGFSAAAGREWRP
jgi:hypothetical protein